MNRVAAEIAKEIGVFLQHHDLNAGARQQESEHHAGGAAAGDAALGLDRRIGHVCLAPLGERARAHDLKRED